jgi:uncharacterized membrane protein
MKFQNSIEIQVPVREVFRFVAQLENVPKWNYYVHSVQQTAGHGPAVGARYHQVRKTDEQDFEIKAFEADQNLTMNTMPGSTPAFERHMRFEPSSRGTRIIDEWSVDTRYPGFVENLAAGRIKDAVAENLGKLKELLETGKTELQDGRISNLV